MTGGRRVARSDARSGLLVGAMIIGVLVAVLVLRPGGDDGTDAGGTAASPSTQVPSPPAAPPSEEAYCMEFRRLAAMQSEYAAAPDSRAVELLGEAADRLIAVGIPASMPLTARGGYYTLINGIYESIGRELDPAAVPGAVDGDQIDGSDGAFTAYLSEYCPA